MLSFHTETCTNKRRRRLARTQCDSGRNFKPIRCLIDEASIAEICRHINCVPPQKKEEPVPEQKAWQQRCSRTAINKFRRAYYVRRNVFHSSSERAANEIANVLRKWYGSTHSQRNGLALQPNKRTFGSHDDGAQMNMCRSTELGPYLSDILQHTWNHDVKVQLFLFRNFPVWSAGGPWNAWSTTLEESDTNVEIISRPWNSCRSVSEKFKFQVKSDPAHQ